VTVYWPVTMTGTGETLIQTGVRRLVVDCKVNPVALVGQIGIVLSHCCTVR
jgi:hypothetical protein